MYTLDGLISMYLLCNYVYNNLFKCTCVTVCFRPFCFGTGLHKPLSSACLEQVWIVYVEIGIGLPIHYSIT